ncbi:PACSIN3 [Cordylochernes scorpioides]|uniref:PACSIN3 n=1 Tax=Cordylochernes scorpioides TaxID=51811 RepID=A0ABY6LGI8_9ARAC|nr:PACSIN3 [Cordylochernes scorpioides]
MPSPSVTGPKSGMRPLRKCVCVAGPEYGTTEAAWKGVLTEAERMCDLHLSIRDRLHKETIHSIKMWQKENFHKSLVHLKEKKEMDDNFKKVSRISPLCFLISNVCCILIWRFLDCLLISTQLLCYCSPPPANIEVWLSRSRSPGPNCCPRSRSPRRITTWPARMRGPRPILRGTPPVITPCLRTRWVGLFLPEPRDFSSTFPSLGSLSSGRLFLFSGGVPVLLVQHTG